jgi:endo-1,4-beta-xylanase
MSSLLQAIISDSPRDPQSATLNPWTIMAFLKLTAASQVLCCFLALNAAQGAAVPSLKDVFSDHFLIGAALNARQFSGQDVRTAALVARHFNSITAENILKWKWVHPREDGYDFGQADQFVRFGETHGMSIIGHTLVWHQQVPDWVFTKDGKPADRDTLIERMRDHIETVVGRYKGRIDGWDVVNEALDDRGNLRQTEWLRIIGPDYIAMAFEFAHKADPGAELYYNDYSLEHPPKREGAVKLIRELLARGLPVHGVGLQSHNSMDFPKPAELEASIKAFAALGVKCMITEMDIDVLPSARGGSADISLRQEQSDRINPYASGLPDEMQQALARRYAELFEVLVAHSKDISRVTFWGATDAYSWLNNWPVRGRTNHPLLFDRQGAPKPAFDAVVKTAR